MKNSIKILFFCFTIINTAKAQKIIDHNTNIWLSNINKYKLSEKFFLSSELHLRRTSGFADMQQFLFRPAVNYKLNQTITAAFGYTYIETYPYGNQPILLKTPENNFWEQVVLTHKEGNIKFSHRLRWENRFIGKTVLENNEYKIQGVRYANRFRYRFIFTFPLYKNLSYKFFDEVFLNFHKNLMPSALNQNWFFNGLNYKLNSKTSLGLAYMQQMFKKADGIHYENNSTFLFNIGFSL